MSGTRRIPARELPYYARHAWQLALANRLHLTRFPLPDLVILLEIAPAVALERIRARGRPLQAHETEAFLTDLARAYDRVCQLLSTRFAVEVVRLRADELGLDQTVKAVVDTVHAEIARRQRHTPLGSVAPDAIEVIATTVSGSFADQKKVERIEPTFRKATDRMVRMHAADSHRQAERLALEIVEAGGRTIVSAGGAGTMNAVLEGCHLKGAVPSDLRLAFMRKGSADLIGKALNVPDDLLEAAAAISESITADRTVPADILRIDAVEPEGREQRRHMVGFGGIGVFGEVPRFTESRFLKYYKGLLGTLFGDLGPFYVGLGLAAVAWSGRCAIGRVPTLELQLDDQRLPVSRWQSVILLNGDLGKDFPLGRGLAFGSGSFRVVILHHRGIRTMLRQISGSRTGALLDNPDKYDATVREVSTFDARPIGTPRSYMVNVDGLRLLTRGAVRITVSGQVLLLTAAPSDTALAAGNLACETS
jgi:diacylglycerol kinase family enzyme